MLKKDKIGIIIVGYNSLKYLSDCLGSIFESSYRDFKVYFVDNKSSDESLKYLEINWKQVEIIGLEKNFGFAKANNIGAEKAIYDGCEYIFLLNPDTLIEKDCLELLYKSRKSDTILQPLILLYENGKKTNLINTSGSVLHYLGFSYVGNYRKNYKEMELKKEIALASGAAMFIPVRIIKKIGLFDDDFFMYYEDTDFSWRARMAGYRINLLPDAIVWHKYSFSKTKSKYYFAERNRLLLLYKNFSVKYLLLIFPISILNEILMLLYALVSGWFVLKSKSYISIAILISRESKKRKNILENIREPENKLAKYLESKIDFLEIGNYLFVPYNVILKIYWSLIRKFI